jgi:hypothetical protein
MADRKISDLTALTTPAAGDYLPIVDISEPSNASKNKRITIEELLRGAPDGTAAAPSIGFESDPDSGLYSAGANQVAISTNGTGRLFINSTGQVGLGTSSPGYRLHVDGGTGVGATQAYFGSSGGYWDLANAGNPTARVILRGYNSAAEEKIRLDPNSTSWLTGGNVGIGTTSVNATRKVEIVQPSGYSAGLRILTDGSGAYTEFFGGTSNFRIGSPNATSALVFEEGATERARIDSSGRLLVGTASDSGGALLQVNGNRIRIATAKTPSSASDTGTTGEICWDANYIYVCTATNTWKRTAISTW